MSQCCVVLLGKGMPLPAQYALPWLISWPLFVTLFTAWPTSEAKLQTMMLKQLPPLSETAARLPGNLSSDNFSLADLVKGIGQDSTVTACILGVANSSCSGQTTPILSLEEALVGTSSQQAGAWLIQRRHLPPGGVRAVAQSPVNSSSPSPA